MNLGKETLITTALDLAAAASATRNGATLDMAGYEGVRAIVKFGDIDGAAVTSVKMQQDSASGMGTAQDLEDTGITVASDDDNQVFIIDVPKPTERYVRVVVVKDGANNTQEMVLYEQYGPRKKPVTQNITDEVTYELHVSPAEGTA